MYDKIGGKIKGMAKATFFVEAIVAIIAGIIFTIMAGNGDEAMLLVGLPVMILGPLAAWVSSCLLYGFGELIDKTCDIARNTYCGERKSEAQSKVDYERISKIEELRSQGLITEEEYQQAISKE